MTRTVLRNLARGAWALGFLIASGAWAQSDGGSAPAATSTTTTSTDASAELSLILDTAVQATLSAPSDNPSPRPRQKRSSVFDDTVIGGVTRNDEGLRFFPSLNASDFAAQAGATGRPLGLNANASDSSGQATANGRALGVNANSAGSSGREAGNSKALGAIANASNVNPAAVASVHGGGNGKGLGLDANDSAAASGSTDPQGGNGKGRALGHDSNASDHSPQDGGNHKGFGHRGDEFFIAQTVVIRNTAISDAITSQAAAATAVPSATPAAVRSIAATNVSDLSSTALSAAPLPVPEPANWLLLALGLFALGAHRVMRRGLR